MVASGSSFEDPTLKNYCSCRYLVDVRDFLDFQLLEFRCRDIHCSRRIASGGCLTIGYLHSLMADALAVFRSTPALRGYPERRWGAQCLVVPKDFEFKWPGNNGGEVCFSATASKVENISSQ